MYFSQEKKAAAFLMECSGFKYSSYYCGSVLGHCCLF